MIKKKNKIKKLETEYNQKYNSIINIDNNISSIKIILEDIKNNIKIKKLKNNNDLN